MLYRLFSLTEGLEDGGEKALYQLGGMIMLTEIDAAGTTYLFTRIILFSTNKNTLPVKYDPVVPSMYRMN